MQLTWYGHAAFLLENNASFRVILDPYRSPGVGTYAPIDDWADLVAISHQNETYHSFVQGIRGRDGDSIPILMDGLKLLTQNQPQLVEKIPFTATEVYENEERKEPIAMVGVTMDGLCILHMGDCGHKLSAEETAACGAADVLLALAGGAPTLALPDLVAFIENLQPKIVIPMHFGNDKINLNLRPLPDFLTLLPETIPIRHFDSPTISLSRSDLPQSTEVWVLPSAR